MTNKDKHEILFHSKLWIMNLINETLNKGEDNPDYTKDMNSLVFQCQKLKEDPIYFQLAENTLASYLKIFDFNLDDNRDQISDGARTMGLYQHLDNLLLTWAFG